VSILQTNQPMDDEAKPELSSYAPEALPQDDHLVRRRRTLTQRDNVLPTLSGAIKAPRRRVADLGGSRVKTGVC